MKRDYKPGEIESKWQKIWEENKIYSPNLDASTSLSAKKPFDPSASLRAQGKPFYNLMMFPYPSAEGMHVGNMYAFTGADVYGRFMRMSGYDVFEPIGLDGFGIHSENYAIKIGRHPKEQAKVSESNFYRQLRATGNGFDWSRKLETYDPTYYKWTQWLFIQLFKAGLAYRAKAKVNWCPSCKTVLADEQVINKIKYQKSNIKNTNQISKISVVQRLDQRSSAKDKVNEITVNVCERCETEVTKKELEQWFFRITKYANRLLANIAKLDWSEKVKIAQRQWIGRSEGAQIEFKVQSFDPFDKLRAGFAQDRSSKFKVRVFTTRPDTLYGATFLVLSPEHPLVDKILNQVQNDTREEVRKYVEQAKKKTEQERIADPLTGLGQGEKTGVFTGFYAINPANNEKIPIWIADYVLMEYGTGAIMGVPAHDQRDFEFAKKYKLPIRIVIATPSETRGKQSQVSKEIASPGTVRYLASSSLDGLGIPLNDSLDKAYEGEGKIINSGEWSGWKVPEQIGKVIDWLERRGMGKREITFHLRDWLISRQRYWGPPIPMIYCEVCAKNGSKADSLNGWPDTLKGNISKQNKNVNNWNSDGWFPVPEKDLPVLLPDVKDWKPKGTGKSPLANVDEFVNTTCPNCGGEAKREADVSDNFLDSSWYFFRYTSTDIESTAFDIERVKKWLPVKMYIGGAEHSVLHLLYSRFITMVLHDLGYISFEEPFSRFFAHGLLIKEKAKMSKSKGNVVVPDEYIRKFGADTLRMYLMFLGPFNQGGDFYDTALEGMYRFVKRLWRLFTQTQNSKLKTQNSDENKRMMHKTIKKVTQDIEQLHYNTAIAAMMEWHNYLNSELRTKNLELKREEIETFLKLLAPFAPHVTEELFRQFFRNSKFEIRNSKFNSIHLQPWPKFDPKFLEEDEVTIVVQVNGKLRETVKVQSSILRPIRQAQGRLRSGQELKVKSYVEELARKSDRVIKYLQGKAINKVVYVEGKVINFVTN